VIFWPNFVHQKISNTFFFNFCDGFAKFVVLKNLKRIFFKFVIFWPNFLYQKISNAFFFNFCDGFAKFVVLKILKRIFAKFLEKYF